MRAIILALSLFAMTSTSQAFDFHQKDTPYNTRYKESPEQKEWNTFTEANESLPNYPADDAKWQEIYISPTFTQTPLIAIDSVYLAPDHTVRYILNTRSAKGFDNLSVEALFCPKSSFDAYTEKKASYKTYAYGDNINKRWIEARQAKWQNIGSILNSAEPIHAAIYRIWCIDGLPHTQEDLVKRLRERGGMRDASGKQMTTGK